MLQSTSTLCSYGKETGYMRIINIEDALAMLSLNDVAWLLEPLKLIALLNNSVVNIEIRV